MKKKNYHHLSPIFLFSFQSIIIYFQIQTKYMQPQVKEEKGQCNVQNFRACMVLAAVGDAMGYKNGDWEFLTSHKIIYNQMMELTDNKGPLALEMTIDWRYSDDTVMHIATAEGLLHQSKDAALSDICQSIAKQYKKCWSRMGGRAPGNTTGKSIKILNEDGSNWNKIGYNDRGCGCGGSMRSACIGLVYYNNIEKLIQISIEAGRMTHHNPVGYLGSLVAAYFTGLAIKGIAPEKWAGYLYDEALPIAELYVKEGRQGKLNLQRGYWEKFVKSFTTYCQQRNVSMSTKEQKAPQFPQNYDHIERGHFYQKLAWNGWPGALGIDSVLIAYDAMLSCKGSWEQLCLRGVIHGGDNDSTGTIAGAWFGAYYGWKGVPDRHHKHLEDGQKLKNFGEKLFKIK